MTEVVVTRKGQATIPAELRAKYRIEEGSRLEVIDAGNGIVFRPKKSFLDLAGSGAEKATVAEMKRLLDKLRKEDVRRCPRRVSSSNTSTTRILA